MRLKPAPDRPDLTRLLINAAKVKMTPAQIREQRISFVFGQLMESPNVTREMVEAEHDRLYGKPNDLTERLK